jgi:hypothetical protein
LAYPDNDSEFILDTDASSCGLGAALSQVQNGEEKVIAYVSRTLHKHQTRYCTTYKELLAVITFIRQFRHFLWGRHFTVRTDHASLIWLKNFKNPEGMLARWLSILETYDFSIIHRPGRFHGNAESLSRRSASYCKHPDCPDCHSENHSCLKSPKELLTVSNISNKVAPLRTVNNKSEAGDQPNTSTDSLDGNPEPNWLQTWSHEELSNLQRNEQAIRQMINLYETTSSHLQN